MDCHGWTWLTESAIVSYKKSRLYKAIIVSDATGPATADIYNGQDTNGRKLITLKAVASTMGRANFGAGVLMENGIFVGTITAATGVLLVWDPIS